MCVRIYIYIYIYKYTNETIYIRRPPLGGHQAARHIVATAVFKSFQSPMTVTFSSPFQSCILQLPVCQSGICFQLFADRQSGIGNCLLDPGTGPLPSPGCILSIQVPPGYLRKIIEFQAYSQDPQKPQKVAHGTSKVTQNTSKSHPEDTQVH